MRVAFYISDYGYGHAARSIAIIRELLALSIDIEIVVCNSFALDFLKNSLANKRVSFREKQTDIGYFLKSQSIMLDLQKLETSYREFTKNWKSIQELEKNFLKEQEISLVISDISPIPFQAAKELGVPTIGVSNFTWYTAYENLLNKDLLSIFKEAYKLIDSFFALAANKDEEWGYKKNYGFVAREVDYDEVQRIKEEVNPLGDKFIIFVGLGMKMENRLIHDLTLWDSEQCVFVVSSSMDAPNRKNVFKIPKDYIESQNYIAASDLVVSKAGWGTVAEAIISNVPLLIIERNSMNEDRNTTNYLLEEGLCHTISWGNFKDIELDSLNLAGYTISKQKMQNYPNEAHIIAKEILEFLN
jgi:uncharacterized protein (TIGR00661 family)